jgi:hypothetical protein
MSGSVRWHTSIAVISSGNVGRLIVSKRDMATSGGVVDSVERSKTMLGDPVGRRTGDERWLVYELVMVLAGDAGAEKSEVIVVVGVDCLGVSE